MLQGVNPSNNADRQSDLDSAKIEEIFLSVPSPESARSVSKSWTSTSRLAGSQNDHESALDLLGAFQSHLGISCPDPLPIYDAGTPESRNSILKIPELEQPQAWIDTYYPLLETPGERRLEALDTDGAVTWSANLEEHPIEAVGAWHAWSKAGDIKGKVVYVNYGYDTDYEKIKNEGYDVSGNIVLMREGYNFRGLAVKAAVEAGAIGCLMCRDIEDDDPVTFENGYKP